MLPAADSMENVPLSLDWREATEADRPFLIHLMKSTILEVLWATTGVPGQDFTDLFYQYSHFDWQIVSQGGNTVAGVSTTKTKDMVWIQCLHVLPEYQNRGIGTAILQDIIVCAQQQNLPVGLGVLKANHRARSLYERLGFICTDEVDLHYNMWLPSPSCPTPIMPRLPSGKECLRLQAWRDWGKARREYVQWLRAVARAQDY